MRSFGDQCVQKEGGVDRLARHSNTFTSKMPGIARTARRVLSGTASNSSDVFVIFGAGPQNIGGALAARLLTHHEHADVHVVGRSLEKLEDLHAQLASLTGTPDRIHTAVIDAVNDPKAVDGFFQKRLDRGGVTGVANCIGSVILKVGLCDSSSASNREGADIRDICLNLRLTGRLGK